MSSIKCSIHINENAVSYCHTCKLPLCIDCGSNHGFHPIMSLRDYYDAYVFYSHANSLTKIIGALTSIKRNIISSINTAISMQNRHIIKYEERLQEIFNAKGINSQCFPYFNKANSTYSCYDEITDSISDKSKALCLSVGELTNKFIEPMEDAIIASQNSIKLLKTEVSIWTKDYFDIVYGSMSPVMQKLNNNSDLYIFNDLSITIIRDAINIQAKGLQSSACII